MIACSRAGAQVAPRAADIHPANAGSRLACQVASFRFSPLHSFTSCATSLFLSLRGSEQLLRISLPS
jgi:hypothetical protein